MPPSVSAPASPPFDYRPLRRQLAERRITHTTFAAVAGLNRAYLCRVLSGHQPGELAVVKIERAMARLGLDDGHVDKEVRSHG